MTTVIATSTTSATTINKPLDKDSEDFRISVNWSGRRMNIAVDPSERISQTLQNYSNAEEICDNLVNSIKQILDRHRNDTDSDVSPF